MFWKGRGTLLCPSGVVGECKVTAVGEVGCQGPLGWESLVLQWRELLCLGYFRCTYTYVRTG